MSVVLQVGRAEHSQTEALGLVINRAYIGTHIAIVSNAARCPVVRFTPLRPGRREEFMSCNLTTGHVTRRSRECFTADGSARTSQFAAPVRCGPPAGPRSPAAPGAAPHRGGPALSVRSGVPRPGAGTS
ncbi:hypothetical protein GCM10010388_74970 [Streptomyces mauvecolor]